MQTILLASNNGKKIAELSAILASFGIEIKAQRDYGIEDVPETGLTFIENALIKARHAARQSGLPAIADDSGLCVPALGGAPGIIPRATAAKAMRATTANCSRRWKTCKTAAPITSASRAIVPCHRPCAMMGSGSSAWRR